MKKFSKLFFAVAAMVVASCTTDATNDLGVELGGHTTITISLEDSRTQLGEKESGLYPVSWSEGDAIAVNGVASTALTAEQSGGASATFSFTSELAHPYSVVYPAPAEGTEASVTEGQYPVTFLATQAYKEGSFCNGAAPMYGYTESEGPIQLNHLTGVLRIAPKGEGVVLKKMVVNSESGKIAGTFDVDCTTGVATPRADATNSVTVTFGEGLALAATPTPIYVAVPAGEYGKFTIILHTETEKMTLRFDSNGEKAISAGKVREFAEFPFASNVSDSEIFLIETKEDLMEFAQIAANFAPYTTVKLAGQIDMTGESWTPIEEFGAYTFDGNKEAGCYIKGLSAPLFNHTAAVIKNLDLVEVNIASNNRLILGAIACQIDHEAVISECHTSGTITVDNPALELPTAPESKYNIINIGGMVGLSKGGTFRNCINEINIQIDHIVNPDNAVVVNPNIGGVVAGASYYSLEDGSNQGTTVTGCVNGNTAKTTGRINYHDGSKEMVLSPTIGGVAGLGWEQNRADLKNNTNYGAIDFNAISGGNYGLTYDATIIGGVFGHSTGSVEGNNNYGTITLSGGKIRSLVIGGVGAVVAPITFYNNHNLSGADISISEDVTFHGFNVAGVLGSIATTGSIDSCTNDAAITVNGSSATDTPVSSTMYYRVAGIVTYTNMPLSNCENKAGGDITINGNIIAARKDGQAGVGVSGVCTYYAKASGSTTDSTNRGDINFNASVSMHADIASTATYGKVNISGVIGYVTGTMNNLKNYGNINIGSDAAVTSIVGNGIHIAGITSLQSKAITTALNEGDINIHSNVTFDNGITTDADNLIASTCIGGIAGYVSAGARTGVTNKGNITMNGTIKSINHMGGIAGLATSGNSSEIHNSGNLTINGEHSTNLWFGGVIGKYIEAATISDSSNSGDVTINKYSTSSTYVYLSGMIGSAAAAITMKNCHNTGVVTMAETVTGGFESYTGGLVGYPNSNITLDNCTNGLKAGATSPYGVVINNKQPGNKANSNRQRIGGLIGHANQTLIVATSVANNAGIMVKSHYLDTGGLSIGGIAGIADAMNLTGTLTNTGDIYYEGRCPSCNFGVGGIMATPTGSVTKATIINTGDIYIMKGEGITDHIPLTKTDKRAVVGGICGFNCTALQNARFYGNLYVAEWHAGAHTSGNTYGMISGSPTTNASVTNCHCGGNIFTTYNASDEDYTGIQINVSNYYNYITGGAWTAADAVAGNCGYISSATAEPKFATVE